MVEKLQDFEKKQNLQTGTSQLHAMAMNQSKGIINYGNKLPKYYRRPNT